MKEERYEHYKNSRKSVIDSVVVYHFNHRCRSKAVGIYGDNRKKILGFGIMALFIGTVICYQDWLQAAFLACMGGVLIFILFAGEFIDAVVDLVREKIGELILG